MQSQELVPDGRSWLGEKASEMGSKAVLKDLIVRHLKGRQELRAVCFTEAFIHPTQKPDWKMEWELFLLFVTPTAVADREHASHAV